MAKWARMAALAGGVAGLLCAAAPASAQTDAAAELLRCRTVSDSVQRLSCYDSAAAAFDSARAQGEVVVLSRAEVAESQRRSFGFNLNVLNPFDSASGPQELDSVEAVLRRARQDRSDRWIFTMEDGSIWRQSENRTPYFRSTPGLPVVIRRAALGSYMMSIDGSTAIRVKRETE
jgi:hypothetical protein